MLIYKYSQLKDDQQISYEKSLELCKGKQKMHLGQLKLFFTELMFLTMCGKAGDKMLYIGAAPGYHVTKLADMFPEINFDLWDPREFEVEDRPNINLNQTFFTDESATTYVSNKERILLMCDLRTLKIISHKKNKDIGKMDVLVDDDMKMQARWCSIIKPAHAYLKFRLAYKIPKFEYLDGTIYLQPYSKISTEARLLTDDYDQTIVYDNIEFDRKMAYFNANIRCSGRHYNKWADIMTKYNLVNNWDNAFALHITNFYLKKIKNIKSHEAVGNLFMEIIDFHKDKYGAKYDILFNKN